MKKSVVCSVLALVCLWVLPLSGGAQTATPIPRTIVVTGTGSASGSVNTAVVMVLMRGPVDAAGLQTALGSAGIVDFVDDRSRMTKADASIVGLRGRLPTATRQEFTAVTDAVDAYARAHRGASVVALRFFGTAADCPQIAGKAREQALKDARARAEAIAVGTTTHVGAIISVIENDGCPTVGRLGAAFAIDPSTLEMTVPVRESVIFSQLPS